MAELNPGDLPEPASLKRGGIGNAPSDCQALHSGIHPDSHSRRSLSTETLSTVLSDREQPPQDRHKQFRHG